ncbi:type II secretion system F family protein [Rhodopirellula bahusiensis]|uniref:type II secretion system F family protein n=1 Tax=Rhodopirellula bahusiensis TaxID=2014065 RepID=UPI0032632BD7
MPKYSFVAQTSVGTIERGTISGSNPLDVQRALAERDCRLVGIELCQEITTPVSQWRDWIRAFQANGFRSIRSVDIELMLLQLSVMLNSGLALQPSLRELSVHCPKRKMQKLCGQWADAIEEGDSFATALAASAAVPPMVIQLAEIGESSGELSLTLRRASDAMEKRRLTKGTLLATLAYPVLVAVAALSVAVYLIGWAIPKLATFLDAMGRKLPAMTQSLLDLSTWINAYGTTIAVFVVAVMAAVALCYRWQPGRYRIDHFFLHVPLFGNLLKMAETQQLAASLSLLIRSGVFLQDALLTAAALQQNQYLKTGLERTRHHISMGHGLAPSLHDKGFCALLSSMVAVGEKTGDLPTTLEHVGEFYEGQVETQRKRIEKLIEPMIIVVVGGIVGYVYVAFFMALMSAGGNFK